MGDQQQGARVVGQHLNKQLARGVIQVVVRLIEQQQVGQLRQHHQQTQFQPLTTAQPMAGRQGAIPAQGYARQPGSRLALGKRGRRRRQVGKRAEVSR